MRVEYHIRDGLRPVEQPLIGEAAPFLRVKTDCARIGAPVRSMCASRWRVVAEVVVREPRLGIAILAGEPLVERKYSSPDGFSFAPTSPSGLESQGLRLGPNRRR
jgi:hypothetical protein